MITNNKQKGFTLVETLVAISILLIAVVGPISLIGDSLHKLYFARDQMVAINLAQEGIEVVRQKRDSDMLAAAASTLFSTGGTSYYTVDTRSATPLTKVIQATSIQQPVYLKGGFYEQGDTISASTTPFTRLVTVTDTGIAAANSSIERQVISKVEWNTGGASSSISVSENLFKWAP